MKKILKLLGLTCITTLVVLSSQAKATVAYKVTGEYIFIEPTVEEELAEAEADAPKAPPREPVDLSNAVLTISHETTNEEGEAETVTLYEGPYSEDFANVGEVAVPTEVKISLQVYEDSRPMTLNSVIGTGSVVHFAYVDLVGPSDEFWLVGSTNQVLDQESRFSVSGDLSFLEVDPSNPISVELHTRIFTDEGKPQAKKYGPVLMKDNTFLIEGNVGRPITAQMLIRGGYYAWETIILEPQSELEVGKLGNQIEELSVTSGSGYHAKLVESWQQSEDYIVLIEAYANEYDQYRKRREAGEPEPKISDDEADAVAESDSESEANADTIAPAEGCEEAVAQESEIADSSYSPPRYVSLRSKARNFKNELLREIVEDDSDPWARYLAIEMGPYDPRDYASQLAGYRLVAEVFDDDFVATNITPTVEMLESIVVTSQNDEKLIPGQRVPEFTLVNYDGEDTGLFELLENKDLVLIDF